MLKEYKYLFLNLRLNLLILVHVKFRIPRYGTDGVLLSKTSQSLGTVSMFAAAAEAQLLHHRVNISFEHFRQLKNEGKKQ